MDFSTIERFLMFPLPRLDTLDDKFECSRWINHLGLVLKMAGIRTNIDSGGSIFTQNLRIDEKRGIALYFHNSFGRAAYRVMTSILDDPEAMA